MKLLLCIAVCLVTSCAKQPPAKPHGTGTFVCYTGKNLSELQDGIVSASLETEGESYWVLQSKDGNTRRHVQPDGESCWVELSL